RRCRGLGGARSGLGIAGRSGGAARGEEEETEEEVSHKLSGRGGHLPHTLATSCPRRNGARSSPGGAVARTAPVARSRLRSEGWCPRRLTGRGSPPPWRVRPRRR